MPSEVVFPEGFLWGAATSAHQVEGNNMHNDWWAWEQAGKVKEPSDLACDHYRRYTEDCDLAVAMGHNAHRFSVEWSRLEPEEGVWDDEALAHYRDVVRALRVRHLEPVVTLHHFTSPQWLAAQGGWTNPKVVDRFARYAGRLAKTLGGEVRYWMTINEPMVYVNMHYVEGLGPPGAHDLRLGLRVAEHMIRAHAAAYQAIHEAVPPRAQEVPQAASTSQPLVWVSLAKAVPVFVACRPWWPPDRLVRAFTDRLFNTAFIEAVTEGRWSVQGLGRWVIPDAKATLDFLGVNYYCREFVRWGHAPGGMIVQRCHAGHHPRVVTERNDLGWDVCPEAFTYALTRWNSLRLPILVTENGTFMKDDARRWRFIARHLRTLRAAIDRGAKVIGYFYWSLLDNFEWAQGFGPRFGLVEVDYATQRRHVRPSGWRYAQVCRTNRLSPDDSTAVALQPL